jgi:hypothetical protein
MHKMGYRISKERSGQETKDVVEQDHGDFPLGQEASFMNRLGV